MATVVNDTVVLPLSAIPTPLIFFNPALAYHISVATYIHIGSLGALMWDVVDNLGNDFKLLYYHTIGLPTLVYFLTRFSLLGFGLGRAVLLTFPVDDCHAMTRTTNAFLIMFISSTTALFYIRVCAVYAMKKSILVFYGIVWLACLGMTLTLSQTFTSNHIGTTRYCGEMVKGHLLGPTSFVIVSNDALVYFGIAYKIVQMFPEESGHLRRKGLMGSANALPALSKALLQDSQFYFLIVVITKSFLAISAFAFDSPFSSMFIIAHLTIVNILSSRVFRNLKMGKTGSSGDIGKPTAIVFAPAPQRATQPSSMETSTMQTENGVTLDLQLAPSNYGDSEKGYETKFKQSVSTV